MSEKERTAVASVTEGKRIVSVIGGDERALYAARYLAKRGCVCRLFYLGDRKNPCAEGFERGQCVAPYMLYEAMDGADCLLLPLPLSLDRIHLNAPYSQISLPLAELARQIPREIPLFGGGLSAVALSGRRGLTVDLLKDEEFAAKNALPTAEGALALAILHHKGLLFGSRCAILGYGRIASALLPMLLSLGVHCTVFARRETARLAAQQAGAEGISFEELPCRLPSFDLVFNTVPETVIAPAHCSLFKKESLFVELASSPYGMSDETRRKLGAKHLFAPSLPGKYAPLYAGSLIGERMLSLLSDHEQSKR